MTLNPEMTENKDPVKCRDCKKGIYVPDYYGEMFCVLCSRPEQARSETDLAKETSSKDSGGNVHTSKFKLANTKLSVQIGGPTSKRMKKCNEVTKTEIFELQYIASLKKSKVSDSPGGKFKWAFVPHYIPVKLEPRGFSFEWINYTVNDLNYWINQSFMEQVGEGKYPLTFLKEYIEDERAYRLNPDTKRPINDNYKYKGDASRWPHMKKFKNKHKAQTWTGVFDGKTKP